MYEEAYGKIGNRKASAYNSTDKRDLMLIKIQDWDQNKSKKIRGDWQNGELHGVRKPSSGEFLCMSLAKTAAVHCGVADARSQKWWSSTRGIWVWGAGLDWDDPGESTTFGDSGSPIYRRACSTNPIECSYWAIGIVNAGNEVDYPDEADYDQDV